MKVKSVYVLLIILMLSSCSNFYSGDESTISKVKDKTTLKDFSILKDPIVYSLSVYEQFNLFGIKNFSPKSQRVGDIVIIINTEDASIFDWVYVQNSGFANHRSVEVKTDSIQRFYFLSNDGTLFYLDSNTGTLEKSVTIDSKNNVDIYCTNGKYILFTSYGYDKEKEKPTYTAHLFDIENEVMGNPLEVATNSINVGHPKSDNEGNFYFAYRFDDQYCICKITSSENKIETLPIRLEKKNYEYNEDSSYTVSYISEDYIYILKHGMGIDFKEKPVILMVNKQSPDKVEKELPIPDSIEGEQLYFFESQYVDNCFYTTANNPETRQSTLLRYDISSPEKKCEVVVEDLNIFFTNNFWLKNSKLYFMNSWQLSNPPYMYVDLLNNECSQLYYFAYN